MECLSIFGSNAAASTTVTMEYLHRSACFEVTLEESGVLTTCRLATVDTDEYISESWLKMTSAFRTSNQVCKAIMKSEHLKDALYELQDLQGSNLVRVIMSPRAPYFQLSASGNLGTLEIEFNKTSDLFVFFECLDQSSEQSNVGQGTNRSNQWEYPLHSLLQGMRALVVASETFVRINDEGIMCIQHQIVAASGKKCFVDFLMVPTADEEDEEDEAASEALQSRGSGRRLDGRSVVSHPEASHPEAGSGAGSEASSGTGGIWDAENARAVKKRRALDSGNLVPPSGTGSPSAHSPRNGSPVAYDPDGGF